MIHISSFTADNGTKDGMVARDIVQFFISLKDQGK